MPGQPHKGGSAHQGLAHIDAPYNFVPLAKEVVRPDWGPRVSHDLPFRDGLSGEIPYTLTALAPLLVGGEQTKANEEAAGEVHFFRTPDGRHAIPGASLRGMLRNVVEIAAFGRFNGVDDKRYGLRDITGRHVAESYTGRVRNRVKPGLLRLGEDGEPELVPCSMARISHRDLESGWGEREPIFSKQQRAVKTKYDRWEELCRRHGVPDPYDVTFDTDGREVTRIGTTAPLHGIPLLTGQISDSSDEQRSGRRNPRSKSKYHDFVLYDPREADAFPLSRVDPRAWRDFLFVHGDDGGKQDMSWPGFWKKRFWQREPVPVFYIQGQHRLQIGLAYMPRLAGDFSIHDMIGHTSTDHLSGDAPDLATLLFGRVGDTAAAALKGRVFFEPAFALGATKPEPPRETILNSPKPSYFPNYLVQKPGPAPDRLAPDAQYATYIETQEHRRPQLRGWKRYPARPDAEVAIQTPSADQKNSVRVRLHTLPAGTRFSGRLVFHNLKPQELGALLWALDLGGSADARHGLGMGKPFGFGQVRIEPAAETEWTLTPNDPGAAPPTAAQCRQAFVDFMETRLGNRWSSSPQVRALLAMADPGHREAFPGQLQHMRLQPKARPPLNQFNDAKKQGLFLAGYGDSAVPAAATPAARAAAAPIVADTPAGRWLAENVERLCKANNAPESDILRGKPLAEAWSAIDDPELKSAVKQALEQRLEQLGLPGPSKKAKALYQTG